MTFYVTARNFCWTYALRRVISPHQPNALNKGEPAVTTASITFELEVALEGFVRPHRYPEDGTVEDVAITDISALAFVSVIQRKHTEDIWRPTSLLDGIDLGAPEMVKLRENILKLYREDAETALFDAQAKRAA